MKKPSCGIFALHAWEIPCVYGAQELSFWRSALKEHFTELIAQRSIFDFWLLMDQGLSLCAAEALLSLKQLHPLRLTCVIPFEEQHIHWPEEDRARYFSIFEHCDQEHLLDYHFAVNCYQKSARLLAEYCTLLFVV